MVQHKLLAGITTVGLIAGGSAVAVAATAAAPKHTTINAVTSTKVKINRYIQDGTRWQHDVYRVRSGGTVTIVNLASSDGPHTFTVVKKSQLPRTVKQMNNCKICNTVAQEIGANEQSNAPPTFKYVVNGKGSNTPPTVDKPNNTAFVLPFQHAKVSLKVTAKPGATIYFLCVIHPWMQAKIIVGK
jgi:hypothetical protein